MTAGTFAFDTKTSIFGTRNDLVVFLGIPLFAAAVFGFFSGSLSNISPLSFFLLYVLFDHFHVYLGIGTALHFPKQTAGRRFFYFGFPVACVLVYALAFHVSPRLFYSLFAYASLFHFGRQQIGWMRVSGRRGLSAGKLEFWLNDFVIYASTFGFVLYRIAKAPGARWFEENDLGYLPWLSSSLVLGLIVALNAIYLGVQVWTLYRRQYFNTAKNVVWISTLITWMVSFVVFSGYNVVSLALIIVHHAAPFVLLTLLYSKKRLGENWRSRLGSNFLKVACVLIAFAFGAAALEFALVADVFPADALPDARFLEPLLAAFSTYHYAIDSFFWRESYNPGSMRFLDPAGALESVAQESARRVS
jgi:hypothetical protein